MCCRFHRLRALIAIAALGLPAAAFAQESRIAAEFRREGERFKQDCGSLRTLMGCAMVVATGKPLHLSFGSIAPGNGMGFGAAFGTRHNPGETWRLAWSADAVRSHRGSWRAGAYMRLIRTSVPEIVVVTDPAEASTGADLAPRPHTIVNIFAETTSLQRLLLYRPEDQNSRATFGMQQTMIGTSTIIPVTQAGIARRLNLSLTGQLTGRLVSLRDGTTPDVPAVSALYDDVTAPGLAAQPGAFEVGGGVRIRPVLSRYVRLDYLTSVHQFVSGDDGAFSFRRWTADLDHEISLYGTSRLVVTRDTNTPNDCAVSPDADTCPPVTVSRDKRGSINLRVLAITSSTGDGARVPFYFQPTLGGRDIDGHATLSSFDNYRFRGPHLLLFRQTFEHSVWGPVGAWVQTDQGMVAAERRGLGVGGPHKTAAFGVTVRAGGLPMIVASYAVGGGEGRHASFTINTSLLGGSSRPSLD